LEGEPIWLAPPEYVMVRKLQYYREGRSEKHLADIAGMITISADQIDFDVLRERIQQYNLAEEWQEAKRLAQG
jgi:hypothetical protein